MASSPDEIGAQDYEFDANAVTDRLARKVQEQARELEENSEELARRDELLRQYEGRMASAEQASYLRGNAGSYILGEKAKHSKVMKSVEAHSEELGRRLTGAEGKAARLLKQQRTSAAQLESKEKELRKVYNHKHQLASELTDTKMELGKAQKRVLELETMFITDTGGSLMQVRKRNAILLKQGEDLATKLVTQEDLHKRDRLKLQEQTAFIDVLKRALELRDSNKRTVGKEAAVISKGGDGKDKKTKTRVSADTNSGRTLVELAGASINLELTVRVGELEKALADMEQKTAQDIVKLRSNHADAMASMKDKLIKSCEEIGDLRRARVAAAEDSRASSEMDQADLNRARDALAAALTRLDESYEVRSQMEREIADSTKERDSVLDFLQEQTYDGRDPSHGPNHSTGSRDVNELQASMSILRAERTQHHTRADLFEREVLELKRENVALKDLCRRNRALPGSTSVQSSGSMMPTLLELASDDPRLEAVGLVGGDADWHDRNFDLIVQLAALKASREKLTIEAATLSRHNKDLERQLGDFQQRVLDNDRQATREGHLKADIETLKGELATEEEERRLLVGTLEDARAEVVAVNSELLRSRVELSQGGEREVRLRAEMGICGDTIAHLKLEIAQVESSKRDEFGVYREQVTQLQENLASARTEGEKLARQSSTELTRTLLLLDEMTKQVTTLEEECTALRNQLQTMAGEKAALQRRTEELERAVVEGQRAIVTAENKPPDPLIRNYEEQLLQTEQLRLDVVRLKQAQAQVELQCMQLQQSEVTRAQHLESLEHAKAETEAKNWQLKQELSALSSQMSEYKRASDTMTERQRQESVAVTKEKEALQLGVEASRRDNDGLLRNIEWLKNENRNHQSKCGATIQQYTTKLSVADRRTQIAEKKCVEHKQQLAYLTGHIKTLNLSASGAKYLTPPVSHAPVEGWSEPRQEPSTRPCAQSSPPAEDVFASPTNSVLDERLRRIQQTFAKIKSM